MTDITVEKSGLLYLFSISDGFRVDNVFAYRSTRDEYRLIGLNALTRELVRAISRVPNVSTVATSSGNVIVLSRQQAEADFDPQSVTDIIRQHMLKAKVGSVAISKEIMLRSADEPTLDDDDDVWDRADRCPPEE